MVSGFPCVAAKVLLRAVIRSHLHSFRMEFACGGVFAMGVGDNNDDVARLAQACSWAIEHHHAGTRGGLDDVGDETRAIVEIKHMNLLSCDKVRMPA